MKSNKPIGRLFNKKPDMRTFGSDSRLPISDKYIGIEIEAEDVKIVNEDLGNQLDYWDVVHDGSLRNYGTEFVSSMLRGADIYKALTELNTVLKSNNITPDFSERTSVHIHVDGRFMTTDHLRVLVLHYLMLEPFLFKYIGNNRETNPYCIPYYKNNRGIRNLANLFKKDFEYPAVRRVVQDAVKYEAMNIHSISEKGSIEFRMHYGTSNEEEIFAWIQVILTMFRVSKETSEDHFFSSFHNVKYSDYLAEVRQFFSKDKEIDLNLCEYIAVMSVNKLLFYASSVRTPSKEMSMHWGRGAPRPELLSGTSADSYTIDDGDF